MITDVVDIAAERISEAVYSEMSDVRTAIEDITNGVQDAIDTLEAWQDEPDADMRIADALNVLRGLTL